MDKNDEKTFPFSKRNKWNDGIDDPDDKKRFRDFIDGYDMELVLEEFCQICEDIAYDDCDEKRFHQWNLRKMAIDKLLRNFPKLDN